MTDYQQTTEGILHRLKNNTEKSIPSKIEGLLSNGKILTMYVITASMLESNETIHQLERWRAAHNHWFPAQFSVTFEGTKKWAHEQLLDKLDRILFFLRIKDESEPFGHIGLYRFNFQEKSCEIDNVIRGIQSQSSRGGMTIGMQLLIDWTFQYLNVEKLYLQVFSDNNKAIDLYRRLGFIEVSRTPLVSKKNGDTIVWEELGSNQKSDRYFIKMVRKKDE